MGLSSGKSFISRNSLCQSTKAFPNTFPVALPKSDSHCENVGDAVATVWFINKALSLVPAEEVTHAYVVHCKEPLGND